MAQALEIVGQSLARLAPVVEGVDVKKVLADGDDVVTIYDLQTC